MERDPVKRKKINLLVVLTGIFITNALVAELIGVKIFSLEDSMGVDPIHMEFFGEKIIGFSLTAGVLIWPVVFITTDIINEYYGKAGVKKVSFLTAGCISLAFVAIWITTSLEPASFWVEQNADSPTGKFDINYAHKTIFRQGMNIIVGSISAFLIGQFLDALVFQKLKKFTGKKHIWLRATGSTLVSQFIDSFVVIFLAFYILNDNPWPIRFILAVSLSTYIYKFVVAVLVTPLIYFAHYIIDWYLGKDAAEDMADHAVGTKFF